jgi:hypothetical protein
MRFVIVTLLAVTSTVTTVAVAQDGTGHGPPKSPIIVMPQTPVPTISSPTGPMRKFFQPKSGLASIAK